jgi:hypothetical protein
MTPTEIRQQGYQALVKSMGFVGMVRFIQQFDSGSGDYTRERGQWLDRLSLDEILAEVGQK